MGDIVEISAFTKSYRIEHPGEGSRIGRDLDRGEPYERELLVDCHELGLSGTAFDVGAHVGNHTLYLAAVCRLKVHSWEPGPLSRAKLLGNVALNPDLDITVHAWGAGATDGRSRISKDVLAEAADGDIEVHRIDDRLDVDDLVLMKIDVEGMEPQVISGALGHIARCRPVIYAETHSSLAHDAVAAILEPLGYRVDKEIKMGSVMERWRSTKRGRRLFRR